MKLKEFKKVLNKIPRVYNEAQVFFILNGKAHTVQDIENDIEWYENIKDFKNLIDITIY